MPLSFQKSVVVSTMHINQLATIASLINGYHAARLTMTLDNSTQSQDYINQTGLPLKNINYGIRKSVSSSGGFETCYLISMTVSGSDFTIMLDTGSSDTALPVSGVNGYSGVLLTGVTAPTAGSTLFASYGDSSSWNGTF